MKIERNSYFEAILDCLAQQHSDIKADEAGFDLNFDASLYSMSIYDGDAGTLQLKCAGFTGECEHVDRSKGYTSEEYRKAVRDWKHAVMMHFTEPDNMLPGWKPKYIHPNGRYLRGADSSITNHAE